MKVMRKLLPIFLAMVLLLSASGGLLSAVAISVGDNAGFGTVASTTSRTIAEGLVYESSTITLSRNGNAQPIHTITFNPQTSNFVPMVYSRYTGYGSTTITSAQKAETLGYDVKAGTNASFYGMSTGSNIYGGVCISDGKIMQGNNSFGTTQVLTFSSDGKAALVQSRISYSVSAKFGEWSAPLENVNMYPNTTGDGLYYYDAFCGDKTDTRVAGVEIVFEKQDNTELTLGGTLIGKVVEIRNNVSSGGAIGATRFILYASNSSQYAASLRDFAIGDQIEITATENIADSKTIMENCSSALPTYGYDLVKDGKNVVASNNLDDSNKNSYRGRTAIGIKPDGTLIILTNSDSSTYSRLNCSELANYFISQGCNTAMNLDGGGSTQLVVENTSGSFDVPISSSRNVSNSLLIIARPEIDSETKEILQTLIDAATELTGDASFAGDAGLLDEALTYAKAVATSEQSMPGDYTKAIMRLQEAMNIKSTLNRLMALASGANFADYSEYALTRLREAYATAYEVFADPNATADEIAIATARLVKWVNAKGEYSTSETTYPQMSTDGNFKLLKFNTKIAEGDITLFTPGQSIAQDDANLKWAGAILLRKNDHGSYVVEKVVNGSAVGSDTYVPNELGFTVVPDDCLVLGAHGEVNNPAVREAAVKGTIFTPHGIDIEKQIIGVGAYFSFETATGDGHTYDWKVTKAPTCDEKGSEILTCTICGETTGSARVIDELDHVYKDGKCLLCGAYQQTNIALGKKYTIGYGTNNATYNANLTDGDASTGLSYQPDEWFGFVASNTQNNIGTATIDLGDDYVIDYASVHTYFGKTGDGVVTPASMKVEVSSDGTNYTMLGAEVTYANPDEAPGFTTKWVDFAGEEPLIGRYVRLTVVIQGAFAFINEIEVYGVPVTEEDPGQDDPGKDDPEVPTITVVVEEEIDVDGELDDTGYDVADWVDNGFWQGSAAELPDEEISGKYTVRTDEENIYIALEIDGTIAPNTLEAYNPDSFVQNTATNIRVWLKKDVPSRTFFDLQFNGTEFTLANWNTNHDAVKDNIKFVINYEDGKLVAEIAVPMANIGIEDDFYLLITYCDTFSNGYNAIHFTTAEHLNNPDDPNDAYWQVTNTYSYAYYTVEDLLLGEYEKEIPCPHEHTTTTTVNATCTEDGYTDVFCDDCETTVSHTVTPALGHDYEDGVCTRCGEEDPNYVTPAPAGKLGDVNCDGTVEAIDYMLLKRHILGTYKLTDEGYALADIDQDGKVEATDYMLLKRAILGTYVIADPNA